MSSRFLSQDPNSNWVLFISFIISASGVVLLAFVVFLFYLLYSLIRRSRTTPFSPTTPTKLHKFSYKELKLSTNSFNQANLIGKGGSGIVFKGILRDGNSIAVKKLDASSLQVELEFQNELQILGSLRSGFVVSLLGYCVEKKWRFLVYEFIPNGSLQGLLFRERSVALNWDRRFEIILDVARALEFLHLECVPPVIHGDIKPGNVLLDSDYRAKISDFGLSRVKVEGECGFTMSSQELGLSTEISRTREVYRDSANGDRMKNHTTEVNSEISLHALNVTSSNPNVVNQGDWKHCKLNETDVSDAIVGREGCDMFVSCNGEVCSIDQSKELKPDTSLNSEPDTIRKTILGKDVCGESCQKAYVTDWITKSQILPWKKPQSDEEKNMSLEQPELANCSQMDKSESTNGSLVDVLKNLEKKEAKSGIGCWQGEHLQMIGKKVKLSKLKAKWGKRFKFIPHISMDQGCTFCRRNQKSSINGWKNMRTSYSSNSEMWSGEFVSRELSSNTSIRGTVFYAAPEYNVTEKSDIYSLGVLILVIVSGRRPLHVLPSPMKVKKANLISWCKLLAQDENVLELVDVRLKDAYNKDQARLCINLALLCLQKTPELRPGIDDVVKILKGEMDLPALPLEFGPSTSKRFSRSRRITNVEME